MKHDNRIYHDEYGLETEGAAFLSYFEEYIDDDTPLRNVLNAFWYFIHHYKDKALHILKEEICNTCGEYPAKKRLLFQKQVIICDDCYNTVDR